MSRHIGNDLTLGTTSSGSDVVLSGDHRNRHMYVVGASRSGKSKFLESLVRQDIRNRYKTGCGLMLLDWHGELYDSLMRWLVYEDMDETLPVLPIDLRRPERIVAWNPLRKREAYASVVVSNLIDTMAYVWGAAGTDATPTFASTMRAALHVLYEHNLSFIDARMLLSRTPSPLRKAITESVSHEAVREQWRYWNGLKPEALNDEWKSTLNRLERFVDNPMLRLMLGQTGCSMDLKRALEEGWIILVCLSRMYGTTDRDLCETYATMLLSELWNAAQERGKTARDGVKPKPFYVYIDEFQRFITPTLAENLDEAGGFGLHLTLANQFPSQLSDDGEFGRQLQNSVMANAGTKVVFRVALQKDLDALAMELFRGVIDPDEVKLVLESTKVLEYEESVETIVTEGTNESRGLSYRDDPEEGTTQNVDTTLRTEQERTLLRPVLGKETSSIQYRPLEEQIHTAAVRINTQRERNAMVRLAETHRPLALRSVTIKDGLASDEQVESYRNTMLDQWDFVITADAAEANVRNRAKELEAKFASSPVLDDEPAKTRRRVK